MKLCIQLSKSNLGKVLILFWLKKKTSHPTKESWQWTLQLAQNAFTFKNFETTEILKSGISLTIECLHKRSSFIQKENSDKEIESDNVDDEEAGRGDSENWFNYRLSRVQENAISPTSEHSEVVFNLDRKSGHTLIKLLSLFNVRMRYNLEVLYV